MQLLKGKWAFFASTQIHHASFPFSPDWPCTSSVESRYTTARTCQECFCSSSSFPTTFSLMKQQAYLYPKQVLLCQQQSDCDLHSNSRNISSSDPSCTSFSRPTSIWIKPQLTFMRINDLGSNYLLFGARSTKLGYFEHSNNILP